MRSGTGWSREEVKAMNEELIRAINTIRGECTKHMVCKQCPLYDYCGDFFCSEDDPSRWKDPKDWEEQGED